MRMEHTTENDAYVADSGPVCWRHDYHHREYVCTCTPLVEGDTGRDETRVIPSGEATS
jgi:hypothetical protein